MAFDRGGEQYWAVLLGVCVLGVECMDMAIKLIDL